MKPETRQARWALNGKRKVVIGQFPFCIGRRASLANAPDEILNDLNLRSEMPHQVSRAHLAITCTNDQIQLVDRGSHLGCIVNGQMIGRAFENVTADLREGENTVCIGHPSGGLVYTVIVTRL